MSAFSEAFNLCRIVETALPRHFSHPRGKLGPARTFLTVCAMRMFGQRGYRRVIKEMKEGFIRHLGWPLDDLPSAAAICRARPKLTIDHCNSAFGAVYDHCHLARSHAEFRYAGLDIIAIDGTRLSLPDSQELRNHFGGPRNQSPDGCTPGAGLMLMWNVSTQQPVAFRLTPYDHDERVQAFDMLDQIPTGSVLVTDRGFPSFRLLHELSMRKQPFLMRIQRNFRREISRFVDGDERDVVIDLPPSPHSKMPDEKPLRLRVIKVALSDGKDAILATSFCSAIEHPLERLGALYTTRWRIETAFREMKVWHALETFSARHVLGVYQEVTAILVFALLVSEFEARIRQEKAELTAVDPRKPLPEIRYNRLMISDAIGPLLLAAESGPRELQETLEFYIHTIWRFREKRRDRPATPRKVKRPAAGYRPSGKRR